jgi:hypothetical protein
MTVKVDGGVVTVDTGEITQRSTYEPSQAVKVS